MRVVDERIREESLADLWASEKLLLRQRGADVFWAYVASSLLKIFPDGL